jgi:hypothetical protein
VNAGVVNGSVLITLEPIDGPADPLPVGARVPKPIPGWETTGPGMQRRVLTANGPLFDIRPEGYLGSEQRAAAVLPGLTPDHFTGENQPPDVVWGLRALELVDDVGIVAVPDLMWPGYPPPRPRPAPRPRCQVLPAGDEPLAPPSPEDEGRVGFEPHEQVEAQRAVIRHCAALHDRFAVLDAPAGLRPDAAIAWVAGKQPASDGVRSDAGQFAALYYPWIDIPDPDVDGGVRATPPSGHVAGVFARVDLTAGVQKAPANEVLQGVSGTEIDLDPTARGMLNDDGVNAICSFPGRGVRVFGARTLVPPGAAELKPWRYVNVRRLLLMLEESIDRATQWVVFEPNTPAKWREVDRVIRNFLDDEWRAGRLDGATAAAAYSVTCDETTNPPEGIEDGQMVCVIGVQPPLPAEFVLVRLGQRLGENGTAGAGGVNGG